MKSSLADRLKEVLDSMSQEQFDLEWNAIGNLNMTGPSFEDAIDYFSVPSVDIASFSFAGESPYCEPLDTTNKNFVIAA